MFTQIGSWTKHFGKYFKIAIDWKDSDVSCYLLVFHRVPILFLLIEHLITADTKLKQPHQLLIFSIKLCQGHVRVVTVTLSIISEHCPFVVKSCFLNLVKIY